MADPFQHSDGRARHRGPGPLEVLMFSLGADAGSDTGGTWGINVLKVREVIRRPQITRAPDLPPAVVGMASPRGELVPVIDLARHAGLATGVDACVAKFDPEVLAETLRALREPASA